MSVPPNADAETIKKAFRREIARYHPDKVIHLGPEFQEMAATRAAELTVAYKTLGDPAMREQYDSGVISAAPAAAAAPPPPVPEAAPTAAEAPRESDHADAAPSARPRRFESERADRDQIVRRAIAGRVRSAVEAAFGVVEMPPVRGFDAAFVPVAKPRFLGSHPPRVLVRVAVVADAAAVTDAWNTAARTRIHAGKSPVVVLLFGRQLAPRRDLLKALESVSRQRPPAGGPTELVVAVVNTGDWTCHMHDEVSAAVRKVIDAVCV